MGAQALGEMLPAMLPQKVTGLDHLVINVSGLEASLAFYKQVGFEIINEDAWRRGEARRLEVRIGPSSKVNVHGPQTNADLRAASPVVGNGDFCLVWDGPVEEAEAYLDERGIEIVSRRATVGARGPARSVYFRDPDGNLWEFMSYPPAQGSGPAG